MFILKTDNHLQVNWGHWEQMNIPPPTLQSPVRSFPLTHIVSADSELREQWGTFSLVAVHWGSEVTLADQKCSNFEK